MDDEKTKRKSPIEYSDELADEMCKLIEVSDNGIRRICEANQWLPNASTILKWLSEKKYPYLNERYARAKQLQAERLVEQMLEIADDTSRDTITFDDGVKMQDKEWINRSRLRVDTRKWIAAKLAPKIYGEKIDIDHTSGGKPIVPTVYIPENGRDKDASK